MEYEQFICAMTECTKKLLSESETVEVQRILKNNGVEVVGLAIRTNGESIAPLIYLEDFYQKYLEGESVKSLAEVLLSYRRTVTKAPAWNYRDFFEYEKIKGNIVFKLINAERNAEQLRKVPHLFMLDFAIVFYLNISVEEGEHGSVLIRNEHMHLWERTTAELYTEAKKNMPQLFPFVLKSLSEFLPFQFQNDLEEELVYVLTNCQGVNGAASILYPKMPKYISQRIGGNYYLLPSSVHELLVVSELKGMDPKDLQSMVREINLTQVPKEEFLSNQIYYFNGDNITEI